DPVYAILLMKRLGPGYAAWDKAATIRFRRPGRGTVTATFRVPDSEVAAIRSALDSTESVDRVYTVELVDDRGDVCAEAEKTVHVRRSA
ncbi:MAG: DUF4442 domain-containing protein, partial [Rhodothermales bacterium]|nr:DUF4442 domain-containing protein [Rhodothermales bacterium]